MFVGWLVSAAWKNCFSTKFEIAVLRRFAVSSYLIIITCSTSSIPAFCFDALGWASSVDSSFFTTVHCDIIVTACCLDFVTLLLLLSWRAYMRGQTCPEEMRNSTRLWIWRNPSLPRVSWQPFIDWGTTQGRLSLPTADVLSTVVKRSMLTDGDKLPSCSRFSNSVVGFTGEKTQPTASKYWRQYWRLLSHCLHFCQWLKTLIPSLNHSYYSIFSPIVQQ